MEIPPWLSFRNTSTPRPWGVVGWASPYPTAATVVIAYRAPSRKLVIRPAL